MPDGVTGRALARHLTRMGRAPAFWAALATVLGLFLRVWRIDQLGEFDFDEVASVWYARAARGAFFD